MEMGDAQGQRTHEACARAPRGSAQIPRLCLRGCGSNPLDAVSGRCGGISRKQAGCAAQRRRGENAACLGPRRRLCRVGRAAEADPPHRLAATTQQVSCPCQRSGGMQEKEDTSCEGPLARTIEGRWFDPLFWARRGGPESDLILAWQECASCSAGRAS